MWVHVKSLLLALLVIAGMFWAGLYATDWRLLIKEEIQKGNKAMIKGHGRLAGSEVANLVCHYFDGKKMQTAAFLYSKDASIGKESCPLFHKWK